jgi:hypothetical protein
MMVQQHTRAKSHPAKQIWLGLLATGCAGGALLWTTPASASADSGCAASYSIDQSTFQGCSGFDLIAMSPAADTRLTMWMLIMDQRGDRRMPRYDAANVNGWSDSGWKTISAALLPPVPEADRYRVVGSADRCASSTSGMAAFIAAVRAARLSESDKSALIAGREALGQWCSTTLMRKDRCPSWATDQPECTTAIADPQEVRLTNGEAGEFSAYLAGASAFYRSDFDAAKRAFASLSRARNAWVREAALYMVARTELNLMQQGQFDRWGNLQRTNDMAARANTAEAAFNAYAAAYRNGRYTASGKGLLRRVYWLSDQREKLARLYDEAVPDVTADGAIDFVNEVDLKLFAEQGAVNANNPVILSALLLARMRSQEGTKLPCCDAPLSRAELDGLRARFSGQPSLYEFLIANHDMYVAHQPQAVLSRIADASRSARFNHLEYSRQLLRGQALEAVRNPGAEAHWRNMLTGAATGYQRSGVEVALALNLERAGKVSSLFAANSPLTIVDARDVLLMNSADAALLRQQAANRNATPHERSIAAYTLLYKRLSRGEWTEFSRDLALIPPGTSPSDNRDNFRWASDALAPASVFTSTQSETGYACPAMPQIAQQLAANPRNVRASMCLGEFTRKANMDTPPIDQRQRGDHLGGITPPFPVGEYNRMAIYQRVIADRTASADDRAYALFRAVNCYAPSGYNTCGTQTIPRATRQGWFNQLKRDYAQSRWARELRYYW